MNKEDARQAVSMGLAGLCMIPLIVRESIKNIIKNISLK